MKLTVTNFLKFIKELVTGDGGFIRDLSFSPQSIATTGTRGTAENGVPADVIILDLAAEDAIVNFTIPRDYDEGEDHLKVKLLVAYVSGTSIDIGPSAVSKGSPTEIVANLATFTAPTTTTVNAAFSIGEIEADLSNLSLERFDNLNVNYLGGTVVSLGVAHVIGARIEYKSALVSYDETDSNGVQLR